MPTETITIVETGTRQTENMRSAVFWLKDSQGREFSSFNAELAEPLMHMEGETVDVRYEEIVRDGPNGRTYRNRKIMEWTPGAANAAGQTQVAQAPAAAPGMRALDAKDLAIMRQTACKCACEVYGGTATVAGSVVTEIALLTNTLYAFMVNGEWPQATRPATRPEDEYNEFPEGY